MTKEPAKKSAKKTTHSKSHESAKPASDAHAKSHKNPAKVSEKKHTASKKPSSKKNVLKNVIKDPTIIIVLVLIVVAIIVAIIVNNTGSSSSTGEGKVVITEYTDYGCPFCARASDTIKQLQEEYGDSIEIVYKNSPIVGLHPNAPKAHEAAECAKDQGKFHEFRDWLFANQKSQDIANLRKAASDLGLDLATFNTCLDSGAKTALVNSDLNEAKSKGLTGTPMFYVGDELLQGAQPITAFRAKINQQLDVEPTVNSGEEIEIILLTDLRCTDCDDLTYAKQVLEGQIPNSKIVMVDYSSEEGKAVFEDNFLSYIPAVLFSKEFESTSMYAELSPNLVDTGSFYYLAVQPHDPTAEICNNGVDDTGDGKVDCADESCSASVECREEIDNNLKLFIMSDCPYGKKAIEALKPVKELLGDDLDYEIHYIASELPDGSIKSLHGQYEVDENVVQMCVEKYSSAAHFNYLYCRSVNGVKGVDWKECAESTGVDIGAVEACASSGEGLDMLKADIKEATELGVTGSPTWFVNNRYKTGGFNPDSIKQFFCDYNDNDGCETTLSSDIGAAQGSC